MIGFRGSSASRSSVLHFSTAYRTVSTIGTLCVILLVSIRSVGQSVKNENATANAASDVPILVELFTSEGCSSCPPADEFLRNLDTQQPVPGAHLIVLSEHVDYWDGDGWKDPNSSHVFTERQRVYVRALGLNTPYTPEFIVDGFGEMGLGDPGKVQQVFQQALTNPKFPVTISAVSIDPSNRSVFRAHIEANAIDAKADVYVAIALKHVQSHVLRGENGGRHLTHVAVVKQLYRIGELQKGGTFSQDVKLSLKPDTALGDMRFIAFVQAQGPAKLLGAAAWEQKN